MQCKLIFQIKIVGYVKIVYDGVIISMYCDSMRFVWIWSYIVFVIDIILCKCDWCIFFNCKFFIWIGFENCGQGSGSDFGKFQGVFFVLCIGVCDFVDGRIKDY